MTSKCININNSFDLFAKLKSNSLSETELTQAYSDYNITNSPCTTNIGYVGLNVINTDRCFVRHIIACNKSFVDDPVLLNRCIDVARITNSGQTNTVRVNMDCHYNQLLSNPCARIA